MEPRQTLQYRPLSATAQRAAPDTAARASALSEAIEALEVLQCELGRLAALRRTDDDVLRLRAAVTEMRDASDDPRAFVAPNRAFRLALSDAAGNRFLAARFAALHDEMKEIVERLTEAASRERTRVDTLVDEHERLVDAIDRSDVDAAPRIISEMIERLRRETSAITQSHVHRQTPSRVGRRSKGEGS